MNTHRKRARIYASWWHIFATIGFIAIPVIFIYVFSEVAHLHKDQLFRDLLSSVVRLFIAYVIAVIIAWITAVFFYRGGISKIALPFFDVLQSFPTFAAMPFAIIYFGRTNGTIIIFLVLAIIWPIFFSLISTLKLIKPEWEEVAKISGLRGFSYIKKLTAPASIAGLVTGSIIGLGDGWEALLATEIIVNGPSGLGLFFQSFSKNTTITSFGILGLLLVIFSINKIIWLPLLEKSHKELED